MNIKERKPFTALILSFLTPGLGQLYNGQHNKALIYFFIIPFLYLIMGLFGLRRSITGLLFAIPIALLVITFFIFQLIDAFHRAKKWPKINLKIYNKWFIYLAIIIVFLFFINPFSTTMMRAGTKTYKMRSASMAPTLKTGDFIMVDHEYYVKHKPKYGDLIIFKYPKDKSQNFIKRIIGTEDDKIELINDDLFINDKKLNLKSINNNTYEESLGRTDYQILTGHNRNDNFKPIIVTENSVFVLGDNRENSIDSRNFGCININDVIGKVLYIYWSKELNRIGKLPQ
jgi:signal peptidase I